VNVPSGFLSLRQVSRSFGDDPAVDGVDLDVARGEVFALLGPSGCGKSTLLRMLAGLEEVDEGTIHLDGDLLNGQPAHSRPVNMMFQAYALFPHMSVEANVAFGLRQLGMAPERIRARVEELLALVKMQPYARRRPHQLSGGQQQRIALARSLAREPKLLLLDEPMAALDRQLRVQMQRELREILERIDVTCIIVTHDRDEAMTMADRIGLMYEGRLVQVGTPEEVYDRPRTRFAAEFLGQVNLLQGMAESSDRIVLGGRAMPTRGAVPGQLTTVALRPEDVDLYATPPEHGMALEATVLSVDYMGIHRALEVAVPGMERLTVIIAGSAQKVPAVGARVWLDWWAEDAVVLADAP
jgi:putrescine transport system ATP-binding protein